MCVFMCTGTRGGRGVGSPGAGVIGGCELLTWVLGTELRSFERAEVHLTGELFIQPL